MVTSPALMRLSIFAALSLSSLPAPAQVDSETETEDSNIPVCNNPTNIGGDLTLESGFAQCEDGRIQRYAANFVAPTFQGALCTEKFALSPLSACQTSSDCQAKPFGHCAIQGGDFGEPYCGCTYACMSDLDCEIGRICAPASVTGTGKSQCIRANCRTNQGCESGQCELSDRRDTIGLSGWKELACRSEKDTCQTDADCEMVMSGCGGCAMDPFKGHFACIESCIAVGRPFFVQGEQILPSLMAGKQWLNQGPKESFSLSAVEREAITEHWLYAARMEQASVAAFARFALQLMHLGAPPELLADTASAMQDEIDHAKRCFTLAAQYSGQATSAGPLALCGALDKELDPQRIALDVFMEGCIGETIAALEALEMSELAAAPQVQATLARICQDEHKHALLAWRALSWMLQNLDQRDQEAVRGVLASMVENLRSELAMPQKALRTEPADQVLAAHGVPSSAQRNAIRRQAIQEVILPSALALLAQGSQNKRIRQANAGAAAVLG